MIFLYNDDFLVNTMLFLLQCQSTEADTTRRGG
jgi:hypothetical protein